MTAGTASEEPTLCINTVLTNITHVTTDATGIGVATGLPAGVSAAFAGNTITISGTPTASGTFNYSIPLTGGCGIVNATGSITVIPSPEVVVLISDTEKCPDTDPALDFEAKNGEYYMGNSSVTFTINRITTGAYDWSFHYVITTDPVDRLVPEASQPQPYAGDISVPSTETDPITLTFYIKNQTTGSVNATLKINTVLVGGCTEAPNSVHEATIEVRRMPVAGPFIDE
jgi:hypothetical protein